jgi:cytochrome P450
LALFQRGNFVRMDPPQHRKLRTLVSQRSRPRSWPVLSRVSAS